MEFIWIFVAFVCGLAMKLVNLPPLIGFLGAGFLLNFMQVQPAGVLTHLSDLGITLMLFCIGLKLHVKDLLKREVWVSTLGHMGVWTVILAGLVTLFGLAGSHYFDVLSMQTAALLGFALSFSSTVCIVKILEEAGEINTRHGQLALGVLVMQDIVAVVFLVLATGKEPSLWAVFLLVLIPLRPLLGKLLDKSGHGEMLPLTGLFLALGGYELFYLVGVKGDLGALVLGILLASHDKASELNKALMNFKDLFLIGFFLSIGFSALPTWDMLGLSLIVTALLSVKFVLFFFWFNQLRLRARTTFLSSLALSNYSEFGLIVVALSVQAGWINKEWLVILALAVSFSFIITSVVYRKAHSYFQCYKESIRHYEHPVPLPEDSFSQPKYMEVLVVGLGRVGRGTFDSLTHELGRDVVAGMDANQFRIKQMQGELHNVFVGDGEDADLWEHLDLSKVKLILLALPYADDSVNVVRQLRGAGFNGQVAAIARYQDERDLMLKAGINNVFNFYTEAGSGFAEESLALMS